MKCEIKELICVYKCVVGWGWEEREREKEKEIKTEL